MIRMEDHPMSVDPSKRFVPECNFYPLQKEVDLPRLKLEVGRDIVPNFWDWRAVKGSDGEYLLSSVKNQGKCGSCYAFASTSCMMDALNIQSKGIERVILSPRDIIRCGKCFSDTFSKDDPEKPILNGCNGATIKGVGQFLQMRGVVQEKDDPVGNSIQGKEGFWKSRCFLKKRRWFIQSVRNYSFDDELL